MALFKRFKEEHLTEDGSYAVVCVKTTLFGIPITEDTYVSSNVNVLGCFSPYYEQYTSSLTTTNTDYKRTSLGFKHDKPEEVPVEVGQTN